jgi:hypothetical protein
MIECSFCFFKYLDPFSFSSNNNPRVFTVSEKVICLLLRKIGEHKPFLCVNTLWIDFDSLIFTRWFKG